MNNQLKANNELIDSMTIMPLGGGQEVGRSCILVEFKGRSLLLDCGSHPGIEGNGSLPFFDSIDDPATIDLILVTHFHIDHCAALPYFTEKTRFNGRIFMTHATKAVMKLLLSDNIKLQVKSKPLYSEQDLINCIDKIEVVDYYQTVEHKGIKFTATKAGHVLGACMYSIEIDGVRILYTGDYSMEEDRHLPQADIPMGPPPDVLIVESTFGTTTLSSREEREDKFIRTVEAIITRRGSCLIPVFALGRAQELLLILDDLWRTNSKLQLVPIYYASKLANKALKIYETFVNMMNNGIQLSMDLHGNPFALQHIHRIPANNDIDSMINLTGQQSCVVMASPGFLQSGVSRYLFERWCDDSRNGVIIAGYTVEGTLAHTLLNSPSEITCLDNRKKPVKCLIEHISFSAHVDYVGNLKFIKAVNPNHIILVHGEKTQMIKLKHRLEHEIKSPNWRGDTNSGASNKDKPMVITPQNGQSVTLRFQQRILADVLGQAAIQMLNGLNSSTVINEDLPMVTDIPKDSILITENFISKVVTKNDLPNFTSCRPLKIKQRNIIPVSYELTVFIQQQLKNLSLSKASNDQSRLFGKPAVDLSASDLMYKYILPFLEDIFDDIIFDIDSTNEMHMIIQHLISIYIVNNTISSSSATQTSNYFYSVEWLANPMADMVADAVVGAILQGISTTSLLRASLDNNTLLTGLTCLPITEPLTSKRKQVTTQQTIMKKSPVNLDLHVRSETIPIQISDNKSLDMKSDIESTPLNQSSIKNVDPFKALPIEMSASKGESLTKILELIELKGFKTKFRDIQLNKDENKLLFRSLNQESVAYVFIQFNHSNNDDHEAVVSSNDDELRGEVVRTLKCLE